VAAPSTEPIRPEPTRYPPGATRHARRG
jgi:hypothetical protein